MTVFEYQLKAAFNAVNQSDEAHHGILSIFFKIYVIGTQVTMVSFYFSVGTGVCEARIASEYYY